jgi:hypothetical protein
MFLQPILHEIIFLFLPPIRLPYSVVKTAYGIKTGRISIHERLLKKEQKDEENIIFGHIAVLLSVTFSTD